MNNPPVPFYFTQLTPSGRGAVASIGITLQQPISKDVLQQWDLPFRHQASSSDLKNLQLKEHRILYGRWISNGMDEDVVLSHPRSNLLEIHCHGGKAAVERILDDLQIAGGIKLTSIEWMSLLEDEFTAELNSLLAQANTVQSANLVHNQIRILRPVIQDLLERVQKASSESLSSRESQSISHEFQKLLKWKEFGIHLTTPWKIVLAGKPNVGKSSLMNALLGYQRSIVYQEPGTTRDLVHGDTVFEGWSVALSDTAGLRETDDGLETAGIELAREHLQEADLRLILFDVSVPLSEEDFEFMSAWKEDILIGHKSDLKVCWEQIPPGMMLVSSLTGAQIPELIHRIVQQLIAEYPSPQQALLLNRRQADEIEQAEQAWQEKDINSCVNSLRGFLFLDSPDNSAP